MKLFQKIVGVVTVLCLVLGVVRLWFTPAALADTTAPPEIVITETDPASPNPMGVNDQFGGTLEVNPTDSEGHKEDFPGDTEITWAVVSVTKDGTEDNSLISQINPGGDSQTASYSGSFTNAGVYEIQFQATASNPDWSDDAVSPTFTVTVKVVEVASLTPDPTGTESNGTNVYGVADNKTITVTATSNPSITDASQLPSSWSFFEEEVNLDLGQVLSTEIDQSQPGITTIIASCGTSAKTNILMVVGVDSLEPDPTGTDLGGGTNVYCVADYQTMITVTATSNPENIAEDALPDGWSLFIEDGADFGKVLSTEIDQSQTGITTVIASCGDSAKTNTIMVVGVDSLTPDPTGTVSGGTNVYCVANNQMITVTATPDPSDIVTNQLPSGWSVTTNNVNLGQVLSTQIDQSKTGITTVIASCGITAATNTIMVVGVGSLTNNPTGTDLGGGTNVYGVASNQMITVTATPDPLTATNQLPSCWSFKTNDVDLGQVLSTQIDQSQPGITTVIASCGASAITNTIVIAKSEVTVLIFTSDHGVLTDYNTDFVGGGGTVYSPCGWWKDPSTNNPVTHTQGIKVSVSVTVKVEPSGLKFDLIGAGTALNFSTNGVNSTGAEMTLPLISTDVLAAKIDILNESISWSAKFGGANGLACPAGVSGPHKVYVLWGKPGAGPTLKRVDWACGIATNATSITSAAEKFRDAIAANPSWAADPADNTSNSTNAWQFLDSQTHGDCITLANVCATGLMMIGIPATINWSWPTADGSPGSRNVNASTCTTTTFTNFLYNGALFNARLVYPGNNFEGFFTVSDPAIKAYTVYTPGGPFTNQTYYYLQVLQFADGVGGDQFWVWNGDQTNGTVKVQGDQEVPGQPHIPVPNIP